MAHTLVMFSRHRVTIRLRLRLPVITVWAGTILLRLYFEVIGQHAALAPLPTPFTKTSNNQIPAVEALLTPW